MRQAKSLSSSTAFLIIPLIQFPSLCARTVVLQMYYTNTQESKHFLSSVREKCPDPEKLR